MSATVVILHSITGIEIDRWDHANEFEAVLAVHDAERFGYSGYVVSGGRINLDHIARCREPRTNEERFACALHSKIAGRS